MRQTLLIITGIALISSPGWFKLCTETLHWDNVGTLISTLAFLGLLVIGVISSK